MGHPKVMCLCVLCYVSTQIALGADRLDGGYFTPENIYRFADHLYNEGDYLRAAGEFQRYLFTFDSLPINADSVFYRIGECYRKNRSYGKAVGYYWKVLHEEKEQELAYHSYYRIGLCYSLMGRLEESSQFLNSNLSAVVDNRVKLRMVQLIAANHLEKKEWREARGVLNRRKNNDPMSVQLGDFAAAGERLPRKNKVLAGLFSTIVPGSGKLYCNRAYDGLQSLFTIGILGWQAWDGFHKDGMRSVKGWIFGVIGGTFYLGNIYGSVVAAEIHNEEQEEKLLREVRVFIHANLD